MSVQEACFAKIEAMGQKNQCHLNIQIPPYVFGLSFHCIAVCLFFLYDLLKCLLFSSDAFIYSARSNFISTFFYFMIIEILLFFNEWKEIG